MSGGSHAGRVALVTGASSGLGHGFALALAKAGAAVVVGARRAEPLAGLVAEVEAAGGRALSVTLDVTDEASVVAAYDAGEAAFGLIDTVVANAGVSAIGSAVDLPVAEFDRVIAANVRGVFLTVREGGRRLLASPDPARGRVVIVASMGGIDPLPGLVAYSASKAAAVMMGRGFARDWVRRGVCVNVLAPGYVLTGINDEWFGTEAGGRMVQGFPRRRLMPAAALEPSLLHLTSDAAAHVTGSVIRIDDGQMI